MVLELKIDIDVTHDVIEFFSDVVRLLLICLNALRFFLYIHRFLALALDLGLVLDLRACGSFLCRLCGIGTPHSASICVYKCSILNVSYNHEIPLHVCGNGSFRSLFVYSLTI